MTRNLIGLFGVVTAIALATGCNNTPPENAAAVLEGTWTLTFAEPGDLEGYGIKATFSSEGQLTVIMATAPAGGTASLNVDAATESTVDGDTVTVTIPRAAGAASIFEGTLSSDENTIDGMLSQSLNLPSGDITVTLPGSSVTLTRDSA